jgi:hypothetical protein
MQDLLGQSADSETLAAFINQISAKNIPSERAVKVYKDGAYFNYHALGLSLHFISRPGSAYKVLANTPESDLILRDLVLDGIDLYNASESKGGRTANATFRPFPGLPLELKLANPASGDSDTATSSAHSSPASSALASSITVISDMSGKDLVSVLGEPLRKGGGGGPSAGSIAIWCDWPQYGIMVEFGGPEAIGPKAWESGKDAKWAILSVYRPNV